MKKTVNKWLLLFASIFLMMTVACSNAAGGGSDSKDDKDKGKGTEQGTDDEPEIQSGEAPEIIEDDDYVGIKIKIKDIPTGTYARRIYVNDRVAGEDFSYGDNGALITNQYAKKSEWGYPFVQADKSYKIVVEFIGADYQTIKKTEPLNITAKKGLGDLVCPNAEYVVEDNILKFKKGAPVIYYGNNTNIKEYSNKKSGPSYAIQVFSDGWADNQYFFFGGEDLSQNTFDFAKNLKKELVTDNKLLLRVWAGLEDKDYGGYVYQIAYDKPFYLDLDKFPKDIFDITQYIPSNDDLKGKVLQEANKTQYIEFASAEDSKGYLPATMYACSFKTETSTSGGTTNSYEWDEINFFYKDGQLDLGKMNLTLIGDGPGLYCALATATRDSGEGIYGTFNVLGNTISLSEDGTYSISGTKGYYEFEDGIIYFKNGLLQDYIAIYDGKTLYVSIYFYTTIDKLPDPFPDPVIPVVSGDSSVSEAFAKKSEVTPQNKDLKGKIFHFTNGKGSGKRDLFFEFAKEDSDPYGALAVTMYPYGFDENDKYTEPYGQNAYTYNAGTLAAPASTSGTQATSYLIFYVNDKYYITADGTKFERDENSGTGLYCTFYTQIAVSESATQTITLSFNDNGDYSCNNGAKTVSGKYTNKNGVITLENKTEGNQYLLYDGEYLYSLVEFIQVGSLPTVSNTSSGSGSGTSSSTYSVSKLSELSGTYVTTVTVNGSETSTDYLTIAALENSTTIGNYLWKKDVGIKDGEQKYCYWLGSVELKGSDLIFYNTYAYDDTTEEITVNSSPESISTPQKTTDNVFTIKATYTEDGKINFTSIDMDNAGVPNVLTTVWTKQ